MIKKPIYIEKLYKYDLQAEPCGVAVPFAKGELAKENVAGLMVADADGGALPCSFAVTAEWQDGSVRFLFVRFMADLPANKDVVVFLTDGEDAAEEDGDALAEEAVEDPVAKQTPTGLLIQAARERLQSAIVIYGAPQGYTVDTGKMQFFLRNDSDTIFHAVKTNERVYAAEQLEGPILKCNGKRLLLHIETWELLENGNVCCMFEGHGTYGGTHRIDIRITAYAGKDYMELSFRLFNDTEGALIPDSWIFYVKRSEGGMDDALERGGASIPDSTGCGDKNETAADAEALFFQTTGTGELSAIEGKIRLMAPDEVRTATGVSNYKTRFQISGRGGALSCSVTAEDLISEANEHFAEVLYGTFFGDFCDSGGGVCATVFQAHQNFPKAVKASREGLCIYLIPEGEEKVCFSSGMAREQRILLHFHAEDVPLEELDNRSLIYQMPISPVVAPEEFEAAGLFTDIITPPEFACDEVELSMIDKADAHGRAYGMMNWGDFPDANYTAQGRGGGRLVWTNNEYDYPHAMFLMYARTGERRFLDYAKTAAWHWMDVDVCHYSTDPLLLGGQWEHTACHNGGDEAATGVKGVMVCSHEWVEGLLDLWHFTGDRRALDTALGIGENVLALLDLPMYRQPGGMNARETGWALRTLIALYAETNDEKWIVKCSWIVDQFKEWRTTYGAWLAPYTDNTVIRTGFMISVAIGSLMRYYRVFPDGSVRMMILEAVDDLLENAMGGHGLFHYKELPSLRRNGSNPLLLEAMYIGYELTGDAKYLKAGMKTFHKNISAQISYDTGKRIVEDAVLVGKVSPKNFAQGFLPLVLFYNAAAREGLME